MLGMETYVRARVDKDYSHLVQLQASAINQCTYCLAMHRRDARKDGWTEEKFARVENWTETPDVFSDEERAQSADSDCHDQRVEQDRHPHAARSEQPFRCHTFRSRTELAFASCPAISPSPSDDVGTRMHCRVLVEFGLA